jgi:hypothetical protein
MDCILTYNSEETQTFEFEVEALKIRGQLLGLAQYYKSRTQNL